MKAIVQHQYGSPDVMHLEEVVKPVPGDDDVLVKIRAVSLNASDNEFLTGSPAYVRAWGMFKPKYKTLGSDIAGVVEAVGKNIKLFKEGDHVFGDVFLRFGGLAEYALASESMLMAKPDTISFEEISTMPQAGVIALQGLRYKGRVLPGQKVLINGAGGGAGSYAIQLAKLYGTEVTAVDNGSKLSMMRGLGADHVIDYKKVDFTKNGIQYDHILDLISAHSMSDYKRALKPEGKYAMVGGTVPALLQTLIAGSWISMTSKKVMGVLAHQQSKEDMASMIALMEENKIKAVIDRKYKLSETPEAFRRLADGEALGKLVIVFD